MILNKAIAATVMMILFPALGVKLAGGGFGGLF
jgi:hypothetical protein